MNERHETGRLLILGASVFQIPIINKAKEMGLCVGIIDIDENAPAFSSADECFVCSIRDYDGVLKIAEKFKPTGIMPGAVETAVNTVAAVCETLHLPGNSVSVAIQSTDKVKMLESFEDANVPHPLYQVIKKDEIDSAEIGIQYPVISKPMDSAGGRGVCIIHEQKKLKECLAFSSNAGLSGDILVQEYMKGPEVSVEILVIEEIPYVLQITDKLTSGEPHFFEVGHSQPSSLPERTRESIKELACSAVKAIGLKNSPAHVEIIVTEQGPKMVELGSRLGADCITSYLLDNSITGVNMMQTAIELAVGRKPVIADYSNNEHYVGVHFIPSQKGILRKIEYTGDLYESDNVIKIEITGIIGKEYINAKENASRFGYVVCKGETKNEALNLCQSVIDKIKFELE